MSTNTASRPPMTIASRTLATALRTNSARSYTTFHRTDGGSDGPVPLERGPRAVDDGQDVAADLARHAHHARRACPSPQMSVVRSMTPSRTSARSPT